MIIEDNDGFKYDFGDGVVTVSYSLKAESYKVPLEVTPEEFMEDFNTLTCPMFDAKYTRIRAMYKVSKLRVRRITKDD